MAVPAKIRCQHEIKIAKQFGLHDWPRPAQQKAVVALVEGVVIKKGVRSTCTNPCSDNTKLVSADAKENPSFPGGESGTACWLGFLNWRRPWLSEPHWYQSR